MRKDEKPRLQCAKCPWKVSTDPFDIPNNYCPIKHANLKRTIAEPGSLTELNQPYRAMACHEYEAGKELPCVGWLANQMGEGNNIALRIAARNGSINANVETVGEQHRTLEDTLP